MGTFPDLIGTTRDHKRLPVGLLTSGAYWALFVGAGSPCRASNGLYIYIHIYIYTHTHTGTRLLGGSRDLVAICI